MADDAERFEVGDRVYWNPACPPNHMDEIPVGPFLVIKVIQVSAGLVERVGHSQFLQVMESDHTTFLDGLSGNFFTHTAP